MNEPKPPLEPLQRQDLLPEPHQSELLVPDLFVPELSVTDPRARRMTPFQPAAARNARPNPEPVPIPRSIAESQRPQRQAVRFTEEPTVVPPTTPLQTSREARLGERPPYRPDATGAIARLTNPANLQDGPSAVRPSPVPANVVASSSTQRKPGWVAPQRVFVFGATSAIAMATQRLLVDRGSSQFFLVARNAERLETVAADLRARGASSVVTAAVDLDNTAAHEGLIHQGVEALGGMDLALLAHGVLGDQREAEASYSATESVLLTNVLSPISLLTWLGNYCERERHGTLAVISSVAGDRGRGSNYVYGTSKAALTAFVSGLRNRLDRHGVHVLTIKPGFVITPMTAGMKLGPLAATPEKIAEGIVAAIKGRRDVVYLPWFWRIIMGIIKSVPERIFKGLNT